MLEKHYVHYIKNDSDEQLKRLFEGRTENFPETPPTDSIVQVVKKKKKRNGRGEWI